ncbi:transglutaminase domain-containing protein [Natronomonas gomsonensis]|uniref:transglutaminase TgpA family protein n=1 Tax=Natronomonas gomsonensis TaxID=1046043 RepID=UPI0015BA435A|nr:transglutaminase domain-containing protein [Natronomonas gomsonensis]
MRALLAACCLAGIVLGGAFAPAVGIQTPVPDLGVEGEGGPDVGGSIGMQNASSGDSGGNESGGGGESEASDGSDNSDDQPPPESESGASGYGGTSAGGYPEQTTVGGQLSLSNHEELVVRSPRPSRWRLGAYERYTGSGWDRERGDRQPLEEPLRTTEGRPEVQYGITVTPQRSMNSLASVWRPAFAQVDGQAVFVSGQRGFTVEGSVEAGETYRTFTYGPPSREAAAAATGEDYPADIESRYTQLPDDTPVKLSERTTRITDDAETPYETASAIEAWLESNKEYSLNASHDRDNDVATEFVYEMDAGYCQYFATTMTAMLRTQDIPARYVTGYGTGESVGNDEYLVRGKNAHAWVEVYFEDVGWVAFDPTPGGGRTQAGRDAEPLEEPGEQSSPSSTPTPSADESTPTPEADDTPTPDAEATPTPEPTTESAGSVNVTLTPDPVPGREVTATVTRDGDLISGATVLFNGDSIGETDADGNVTGEVPYNRSLNIEVRLDGSQPRLGNVGGSHRRASLAAPTLLQEGTTVSFDVPTEIDIELLGEPVAGGSVDIVANVSGEPVRNGSVRLDGSEVARTDDGGQATVPLPDAETVEIVVERGDASGNRTVNLTRATPEVTATPSPTQTPPTDSPNLTVEPSWLLALPTSPASVVLEYDGQPVPNATIAVDGETVGTTDRNGTIAVTLPFADSTTVTASASPDGPTTATTVEGMYRNLAIAGGGLLAVVVGGLGMAARYGLTPRVLARLARRTVVGTGRRIVAGLVGLAGVLDEGLSTVTDAIRYGIDRLGDGVEGAAALLIAIGTGTADAARRTAAFARSLPRRLHPAVILAWLRGAGRSAARSIAAARGDSPADATVEDEQAMTIRAAWQEFRRYVSIRSWRTSTPGEIGRWAVSRDGLPADAVATLRDAFRDVEYGARSPEDHLPDVEAALEEIRSSKRDAEEGEQ